MTEHQPLFLYVPLLHKELVDKLDIRHTANVPIYTLWPGLPEPTTAPVTATVTAPVAVSKTPNNLAYKPTYPYSPAQALTCLHDWKSLATEQGPNAVALRKTMARQQSPLDPAEEQALTTFAKTGTVISESKDTETPAKTPTETPEQMSASACSNNTPAFAEAQQRLLMVWLQEEHVIDIKKLITQYHLNAAALTATLADTPQRTEVEPAMAVPPDPESEMMDDVLLPQGLLPDDASSLLPPWSFVLENMAPFLPEQCVLYSADVRMWQDLQERGIHFEPIPQENKPQQLQTTVATETTTPRVLRQYLTLWEMLGKNNPVPEAPWLNTCHEIRFVIPSP